MHRPTIICHMMASIDGRIDCAMTEQLPGVDTYYQTMEQLGLTTTLTGRVTAQTEMALPGVFESDQTTPIAHEAIYQAKASDAYEVVMDTKGSLLWSNQKDEEKPLLVITSTSVSNQYLDYLRSQWISYIVCGEDHIDLSRACDILADTFNIKRLGIVGGPTINGAFLKAGLIDEVSLVIGPGIDGRKGFLGVFDGLDHDAPLTHLTLKQVKQENDGSVWLWYSVNH